MVELENIGTGELMDLLQTYPWFAVARAQLCVAIAKDGGMDAVKGYFTESLPYMPDGAFIYRKIHSLNPNEYKDENLAVKLQPTPEKPRVMIAGMDFFSKEDYEGERTEEDASISRIAVVDYNSPLQENTEIGGSQKNVDLISETLAQIYANQGYPQQAKEIYLKLSLESPEKSAYFASLIDNLNR